jgi:TM2 domain-containing membrane protein YozV
MENFFWIIVIAAIGMAGYQFYRSSQEESKEARTVASLPPSVQHVVAQMDGGTQAAFFNEYDRKKKRKSVGYLAWFFLGWHYLYAKKVGMQFAFWFTGGGFLIWWFVDFFRMPGIIRSVNEQMAREALQTLHIGAAFASMPAAAPMMTHAVPGFTATTPPGFLASPDPVSVPAMAVPASAVDSGWRPDPSGRHESRYWDGANWTPHVSTQGVTAHDPL